MKVNYAKKKRRRWCGCAVPFFVRQVPRRCRRGSWRISRNLENTKKKNRCWNVCRRICFNRRQHWEKEDVQDAGRTHQITDYADDNGALIDSGHHLQRRRETHHYPNSLYARSLFLSLSLSPLLSSCLFSQPEWITDFLMFCWILCKCVCKHHSFNSLHN